MMWFLLACKDEAKESTGTGSPTWADIAPVMEQACVGCHHAGGVGTGDFTTYAGAGPKASIIGAFIENDIMPPPAMDPNCRAYVGHERMVLTPEAREQILAWASAGGPEGEPVGALSVNPPTLSGSLTEVVLPVAHRVEPEADGNEYHCQVLENPFVQTTYITGFDVLVDQPSVVHHTVLAIDHGGDAGQSSGDSDINDGWNCKTPITESDWAILHAWAPGMEPTAFRDGLGLKVEPGDQLVLQMHYFGDSDDIGVEDQSGYRFRVEDAVDTEIHMDALGPTGFVLAADEVSTKTDSLSNDFNIDVTVYGVFPHMHMLATGYRSTLEGPDGEECLASADRWDFGHQATYLYEEPAIWNGGESVVTECTYDNTSANPNQYNDPPQTVTYGEGTNQEMCFFLFYYSY